MSGTLVGYARCSTDEQDLTAQRDRLVELGVDADRIYLDHGLTGTNLAARTLRDLITGASTELTELPWVERTARRWEPEPLRWLGASSLYTVYRFADRQEDRSPSGATSLYARVANLIAGR